MPAPDVDAAPERPLRIQCTFDRRTKVIRFHSCTNCSLAKLQKKVEQAFPELKKHYESYSMSFKDDNGEITDISSEDDLDDAIQYFQTGITNTPASSSTSDVSTFSDAHATRQPVVIEIDVTVEYEGRLSDTSRTGSFSSLDSHGHTGSFTMSAFTHSPSLLGSLDDDQVTVTG